MKEAEFSRNFMKAWAENEGGFFYHKIADVPMTWMKDSPHAKIPRAVDYMCCINSKFCAIEWKLIRTGLSMNFGMLREVQVETLKKVRESGGVPLIMIGYYQDNGSRVYVFTIDEFLELEREAELVGKKSIKLTELDRFRINRERIGRKMIWRFDQLPIRDLFGWQQYWPEQSGLTGRPLTHRESHLSLSSSLTP